MKGYRVSPFEDKIIAAFRCTEGGIVTLRSGEARMEYFSSTDMYKRSSWRRNIEVELDAYNATRHEHPLSRTSRRRAWWIQNHKS